MAVAAVTAAAWTPQAVADGDGEANRAVWSARCAFVINKQIDPIGQYGVFPSMHMHSFSGFADPDKDQTPFELRHTDPNECVSPDLTQYGLGVADDLTSYWVPALGSRNLTPIGWAQPYANLVYYRNARIDPETIKPFPQDLSFVAGDKDATLTNPQPDYVMYWSCVAHQTSGSSPNEVGFGPTIPATCPKYLDGNPNHPFHLRLVIRFPNCINLDTGTSQNGQWNPQDVAYASEIANPQDAYTMHCADEDMDPIPQIQVGFRWDLDESLGIETDPTDNTQWDLSSLMVASDLTANQHHGVSAHADFMSGWSDDVLDNLMKTCYWSSNHNPAGTGPRNCGAIGGDDLYDSID